MTIKALLALKAAADTAKREKEAVEQKQASLVKATAQAVIKRTKDKQQTPAANWLKNIDGKFVETIRNNKLPSVK